MSEPDLVSIFLGFFLTVFGDYAAFVSAPYLSGATRVPAKFNKERFAAAKRDGPVGELLQDYIHSQVCSLFSSVLIHFLSNSL